MDVNMLIVSITFCDHRLLTHIMKPFIEMMFSFLNEHDPMFLFILLTYRSSGQESSLTLTMGLILVSYLVCNVPANLILLLDPGADLYTGLHLPCYILAWLSSILKAACYIACTANFRSSLREIVKRMLKCESLHNIS